MTLIDSRIPAGLDADGMSPDERRQYDQLRAHRVLGQILMRIPLSIPVPDLVIRGGALELLVTGAGGDHAKRANVMALGEQFELDYTETPHGDGSLNWVAATGTYSGVRVKFWQLVDPCDCGCGVPR